MPAQTFWRSEVNAASVILLYFISALDKTLIPTISIRAERFSTGITALTSQLALMLV